MAVWKSKSIDEILQDMVSYITSQEGNKITDFSEGSVIRVLLGAVAEELHLLQAETVFGWRDVAATALYNMFRFQKKPATKAYGSVKFYTSAAANNVIVIPKGTKVESSNGTSYVTTQEGYIAIGDLASTDISIESTQKGKNMNTASGTVVVVSDYLPDITSVNNANPITGGSNGESDVSFENRFYTWVRSMGRSSPMSVAAETLNTIGVRSCYVREHYPCRGSCTIYVDDGSSNTSDEILMTVRDVMEGETGVDKGHRPVGITFFYAPAEISRYSVKVKVSYEAWGDKETVDTKIAETITNMFDSAMIGDSIIISKIVSEIQYIYGVKSVKVSSPVNDLVPNKYTVVKLSSISIVN